VREYWIVEPETKTVQACTLKDGQYILTAYGDEDTAPVNVLPGCEINLTDVFA
jgi:Uma2 family endonuclease